MRNKKSCRTFVSTKTKKYLNFMKTIIIQLGKRDSTKELISKLLDAGFYFFKMSGEDLLIEADENSECIKEIIAEMKLDYSFI